MPYIVYRLHVKYVSIQHEYPYLSGPGVFASHNYHYDHHYDVTGNPYSSFIHETSNRAYENKSDALYALEKHCVHVADRTMRFFESIGSPEILREDVERYVRVHKVAAERAAKELSEKAKKVLLDGRSS